MGEIVNESLLGDVNGQVGNTVVSHIGPRKYIKQKGKKKNNHTKPRQKTEERLRDLSHLWTSLTITEKRTWFKLLKSNVKLKNKKNTDITGARQLFMSLNRNLQEIGEPVIRVAQGQTEPQIRFNAVVEMALEGPDLSMNLHLLEEIEQNTKVIVYATPSITNPSDTVNERLYRYITVIDSNFVSGSSIKEEYLKVFEKTGGVGEEFSFKFKTVNKITGVKGYEISYRAEVISLNNQ